MAKYRKKPVVVEAKQFTGDNLNEMEMFVPTGKYHEDGTFSIVTLEGEMHVSVGDYVIQGVNGEFYPCKPDIFEKTYEEEPSEERWTAAIENAKFMLIQYKSIPNGGFGAIGIANDIARYENGERTKELLDDLEGIQ